MPLLSRVEAAIALGIGVELVDYFVKTCPKRGETQKLQCTKSGAEALFAPAELNKFAVWLRLPWPKPPDGKRPHIPDAIADDVRRECHQECAICGRMDNGEVAHIEAVSKTLDNSPENLILLCPNHHTKYDLGFKPASNVTSEVVKAAKIIKQESRRRMLMYEANVYKTCEAVLRRVKELDEQIKEGVTKELIQPIETEMKFLMRNVQPALANAQKAASQDKDVTEQTKLLLQKAKPITKAAAGISSTTLSRDLRSATAAVVLSADEIFIDLDEEPCPHCGGRGMTGLNGKLCSYCDGEMVVTRKKLKNYDASKFDEVECPHCGGTGQVGLIGELCSYCGGDQTVTEKEYEAYDKDDLDEVPCPLCEGRGQFGLAGNLCPYCHGSQVVSGQKAEDFDFDDLGLVKCPKCGGSGQQGLASDFCSYCKGACLISKEKAKDYDPEEIDEVDCPHCNGQGQTGLDGNRCAYCKGSCVVSRNVAAKYDPEEIDEEDCPRCGGTGLTGISSNFCKLCKGNQVVTRAVAAAYREKYGGQN